MSRNVAGVRVVEPDDVPPTSGLPDEVTVTLADIATVAREGLFALSVSTGLAVMAEMMEAEITQIVGPKHAKLPDRTASRHTGATTSSVSRRFVQATREQVEQLLARDLTSLEVAVLMIDGIIFADHCCVVALRSPPTAPRSRSGCGWGTPRTPRW